MAATSGILSVRCLYCDHTWTEALDVLQERRYIVYRHEPEGADERPVARTAEYLVQCPRCGRRLVVTVQVRGE